MVDLSTKDREEFYTYMANADVQIDVNNLSETLNAIIDKARQANACSSSIVSVIMDLNGVSLVSMIVAGLINEIHHRKKLSDARDTN